MILVGDQPDYLPYLGFFHKMINCDKYMIVDHVQYSKKSFQTRYKIRPELSVFGKSFAGGFPIGIIYY